MLFATLIGCTMTAGVAVATWADGLERLELIALDWRFRTPWINPIRESDRITCIDIGDRDLETTGRWPWPRDVQAGLLRVLGELRPSAILVDITYVESESVRTDAPQDADVVTDPLEFDEAQLGLLYPDYELGNAIAEAGNVYLAFHHPHADLERSDEFNAAVDALHRGETVLAQQLIARVEARHARLRRELEEGESLSDDRPLDRARIVALLEENPELDERGIANAIGLTDPVFASFVETAYQRCLAAALRRRAQRWFAEQPERWKAEPAKLFRSLFESISKQPFENESGLRRTAEVAFREVLGLEATARKARVVAAPGGVQAVEAITPVYFMHARAARGCGFVNFEPDRDGVMRRERLLIRYAGETFAQLAFSVGLDLLRVPPDGIEFAPRRVVLRGSEGVREIQVDDEGRTVVPWVSGSDYTRQFTHLRADAVLMVDAYRRLRARNSDVIRATLTEIATDPFFPDHARHAEEIRALRDLERQIREARYRGRAADAGALQSMLTSIERSVAEREAACVQRVREAYERIMANPAAADQAELAKLAAMMRAIEDLQRFSAANAELTTVIDDTRERLRPLVENKVCLIGYTATSLADMTPIPTHPRAPGVMAHANLLNGLLTGQLVRWQPQWASELLTVLCGMGATAASLLRRPRNAVLAVSALAAAVALLAGWAAFRAWLLWVPVVPPIVAILAAYVAIAVFRYIYVEGERRHLSTALAQYTSKEIARQVAENPELCRRAESREVTAMFTDLRGFTGISERIGAERTQKVLNACLGSFSEVMLRHEAMINKFIGDGIFAFWNPVIYPQPDHALRACETAVDLFRALDELKEAQRRAGGDGTFAELALRVGVATGQAIVGPCGSSQKYDYTCIGDSVNVAARLESANKFYGTRVLVSGPAREQVGSAFHFRALGGVQVKGKRAAVPIFELLGRVGEVSRELLDYAERFGEATAAFQARNWRRATELFEKCAALRPDDLAAVQYIEATAYCADHGPAEDWNGALELKEK